MQACALRRWMAWQAGRGVSVLHCGAVVARLEDSYAGVRSAALDVPASGTRRLWFRIAVQLSRSGPQCRRALFGIGSAGKLDAVSLASHGGDRRAARPDAVRYAALIALGNLDAASLPHGGAIVARLDDSDAPVRAAALSALGKLDAASLASHGGAIVARLEDRDEVLCGGAYAWQSGRGVSGVASGAIVARLKDSDAFVRRDSRQPGQWFARTGGTECQSMRGQNGTGSSLGHHRGEAGRCRNVLTR